MRLLLVPFYLLSVCGSFANGANVEILKEACCPVLPTLYVDAKEGIVVNSGSFSERRSTDNNWIGGEGASVVEGLENRPSRNFKEDKLRNLGTLNQEWTRNALQGLGQNEETTPKVPTRKNTFNISSASSSLREQSVDIGRILGRSKAASDRRNPASRLREMQLNNLAPVEEIEEQKTSFLARNSKRNIRVLLAIPESRNPSSPTSRRNISIYGFLSEEDLDF